MSSPADRAFLRIIYKYNSNISFVARSPTPCLLFNIIIPKPHPYLPLWSSCFKFTSSALPEIEKRRLQTIIFARTRYEPGPLSGHPAANRAQLQYARSRCRRRRRRRHDQDPQSAAAAARATFAAPLRVQQLSRPVAVQSGGGEYVRFACCFVRDLSLFF